MNSFPRSYLIIVGLGYLYNRIYSARFAIVAACLSLFYFLKSPGCRVYHS